MSSAPLTTSPPAPAHAPDPQSWPAEPEPFLQLSLL